MSVVSAAATYAQQDASADAQEKAWKREADIQQSDLQRQGEQQREATAGQMNEQARAAARDLATFGAITGEFGGGGSARRGAATLGMQHGEQLATIQRNGRLAAQDNSFASLSARSTASSRLASIQRPSVIGTALQIGGAAAGYYAKQQPPPRT